MLACGGGGCGCFSGFSQRELRHQKQTLQAHLSCNLPSQKEDEEEAHLSDKQSSQNEGEEKAEDEQVPDQCEDELHRAAIEQVPNEPKDDSHQAAIDHAAELRSSLRNDARQYFSTSDPLTEQEENWMTEEILGIYVRARETPSERLEILVPALKWRMSNRELLRSCDCPYCAANPKSHDARLFGFDSEGDFVFMNCFELPHDISVDSVSRHMTCLMERTLTEFPNVQSVQLEEDGHPKTRRWTFIFDLYGFGFRYYDPRVTYRLLELFQVVHRGRVKKLIVLDAPLIFWGFWKIVKPFLNTSTTEKLEFSDWEMIRSQFEVSFGVSLTAELFAEAAENRDPNRSESKTWITFYGSSLHKALKSGDIPWNPVITPETPVSARLASGGCQEPSPGCVAFMASRVPCTSRAKN